MSMPKAEIQQDYLNAWRNYLDSLDLAIKKLDTDIKAASEMARVCTDEWCEATEHVIDELSNALFDGHERRDGLLKEP
jgi:hypothetical protein